MEYLNHYKIGNSIFKKNRCIDKSTFVVASFIIVLRKTLILVITYIQTD